MAGRIPEKFIRDLLDRVDIVEEIGSRIEIRQRGRNHIGLCPFHSEKTPSFNVVPDKQFYHCFGCQKSGSVLSFLMEYDHLNYVQAVEALARSLGMEVPREAESSAQVNARKSRENLYATQELAAGFFARQLRSHSLRSRAVDYLKGRGLTGETAKRYGLGYAPPGGSGLLADLGKDEAARNGLLEAGLLVQDADGRVRDRFRDRVIFPIRDRRGRVIAFGGRVLGDGKPKYLNSPGSSIFEKGRELYGLYEALKATPALERIILVEGYMDVTALAQMGITNTVATLGTAITQHHVQRLFSVVDDLVFAFDGDTAGRMAGWKAAQTCLPLMNGSRTAGFLFLPQGEDPDSLVRKEGRGAFQDRLKEVVGLSDMVFDQLTGQPGSDPSTIDLSLEERGKLTNQALKLMAKIPQGPYLSLMKKQLQEFTRLDKDEFERLTANLEPPPAGVRPGISGLPVRSAPRKPRVTSLADKALRMLLKSPALAFEFELPEYQLLSSDAGLLAELAGQILQNNLQQADDLLGSLALDASYLDHLQQLRARDWELSTGSMREDYRGAITRILESIRAEETRERIASLKGRRPSDLSADERAQLKNSGRASTSLASPLTGGK